MGVSEQKRGNRKNPGDLFFLPATVLAFCAVITIAARLQLFWELSRFWRVVLIGTVGLLITPMIMAVACVAWRRMAPPKPRRVYALPLLLLSAGMMIGWLDVWPVRFPKTLHEVEVSTFGVSGTELHVLEVRDAQGNVLTEDALQLGGEWEKVSGAYTAQGGQKVSLTAQFFGPDTGSAQVVLAEGPTAGDVTVKIDRTLKKVSLKSVGKGSRLIEGPLIGRSKTGSLLQLMWFVTVGLILPLILFVVIYQLFAALPTKKIVEWDIKAIDSIRHAIFMAVIFLLAIQPLRGMVSLKYFDNQFWGREKLLRAYSEFRFRALGDKIFTSFIVGNNNWLTYTGEYSLDDFQNTHRLTEAQLELLRAKIDTLDEHLSQRGIKLLIVITPNKNTIYPDRMPEFIPMIGDMSRHDQVIAYQQEHGRAQILDLRPALIEAREEQDVYYTTDTHWNPFGAYIGYREIMKTLSSDFSALHPHRLDEYTYVSNGMRSGDTVVKLGQIALEEEYFSLKPNFNHPPNKQWETTAKWSNNIITTALLEENNSLPRLMMYHDSFGLELMPFMNNHFSRIVYVSHFEVDEAFIYSEQPDIVIIEITERYLYSLASLPILP